MKILNVMTEYTNPFKLLIEVLKEILVETNIEFRANTKESDIDDSYMKIMAIDTTNTVFIYLKLDGKEFTKFDCKNKKITIGVNLGCFYKLIKSMDKEEYLTLYMDSDNINMLNIKIENPKFQKNTVYNLKLLELGIPKIVLPKIKYDSSIIINSSEFHKICKEMSVIADLVEIKCFEKEVIFTCKGDYANRVTTFSANTDDMSSNKNVDSVSITFNEKYDKKIKIVQGVYELRNLALFSRCAQLCENIQIFMKNNKPLIINYTVASLGKAFLCLSPITNPDSDPKDNSQEKYYDFNHKMKD